MTTTKSSQEISISQERKKRLPKTKVPHEDRKLQVHLNSKSKKKKKHVRLYVDLDILLAMSDKNIPLKSELYFFYTVNDLSMYQQYTFVSESSNMSNTFSQLVCLKYSFHEKIPLIRMKGLA